MAPGLIDGDPEAETILGDSAYGSGELRAHLEDEGKTAVIDAPPLRTAIAGGFSLDDFDIDIDARTVTCPAGVTVGLNKHDQARFGARCATGPLPAAPRRCPAAATSRRARTHHRSAASRRSRHQMLARSQSPPDRGSG